MRLLLGTLPLALAATLPACVTTQQDHQALETRTAKLEATLAEEVKKNEALRQDLEATRQRLDNALRASADSNLDVVTTKQRLNDIAGRLDETRHALEEARREVTQSRTEIYARLDDLKRGTPATAAPQVTIPADKSAHLAQLKDAFTKKDWPLVRALGPEYVNRYPTDASADEALWITGEADLADGRPTAALASYNRLLKLFPRTKLLDKTLFSMGEAYMLMKDCPNAKLAYEAVEKRFPKEKLGEQSKARLASIAKKEPGLCAAE